MLQAHPKTAQTLLSPRIPRDSEHERYDPETSSSSASTSGRRFCAATATCWPAPGSWGCTPS